jgi:pilus assembly protein CpaB
MRAISVAIDEVSGNAGLILPGDYVDLLLTQTVGTADDGESRIVSETVLSNVRVIAVGRTLRVDGTEKEDAKGGPAKARTTTLEVRPSEAEVVAVAARLGSLSLALRSLATLQRPDEQTDPATGGGRRDSVPVWAEDVSMARRLTSVREKPVTPPAAPPPMVRVIRGSSGSEDIAGRQQMPPIFGDDGGLE